MKYMTRKVVETIAKNGDL